MTMLLHWRMRWMVTRIWTPFTQCGRRKELTELLSQINVGNVKPLKFEITASQKDESRCTLYGVFIAEQTATSRARARTRGDVFESFMERERQIKEAVVRAFKLVPEYTNMFAFTVSITRTRSVTSTERAKLTVDGLRYFKVSKDVVSVVRQLMAEVLKEEAVETTYSPPRQHMVEMTEVGAAGIAEQVDHQ